MQYEDKRVRSHNQIKLKPKQTPALIFLHHQGSHWNSWTPQLQLWKWTQTEQNLISPLLPPVLSLTTWSFPLDRMCSIPQHLLAYCSTCKLYEAFSRAITKYTEIYIQPALYTFLLLVFLLHVLVINNHLQAVLHIIIFTLPVPWWYATYYIERI
jgi:hypothetical protein